MLNSKLARAVTGFVFVAGVIVLGSEEARAVVPGCQSTYKVNYAFDTAISGRSPGTLSDITFRDAGRDYVEMTGGSTYYSIKCENSGGGSEAFIGGKLYSSSTAGSDTIQCTTGKPWIFAVLCGGGQSGYPTCDQNSAW